MSTQREAIRSNAKYLRNVRPIDPDEICEYVEGTPHPAVVRQHLREDAVDLGLIEREDGTFEPVPDEAIRPDRRPVTAFPRSYADALEDVLVDRYGANWYEDAPGDLLRSTIRRFKANYLERRPVEYDEDVAAGYAIYHLPAYYAAIQYALEDLADRGLLDRTMRVLDVGAGVGGPALGLADYVPEDALLEYHAIEPSSAADILEELLTETGRNVHTSVHRTTAEAFDPAAVTRDRDEDAAASFDPTETTDGFDLVLVCNVLSELADPEAVLRDYLELLAPDGTLVAIAPADKNTSVQLRDLERTLEDERLLTQSVFDNELSDADEGKSEADTRRQHRQGTVTVYSPAVRLWPGERPSDRGWSFDVRPDLEVPTFQRNLDEATPEHDDEHAPGEFVNVDVQYSSSLLRLDGTRRIDVTLEASDWAKMAEMDRHVTNRIDLTAAKLSHSLSASDDEYGHSRSNPVFKISDGSESIGHYAVLTNETSLNRPLREAEYGSILSFEQILVLWNDDEQAYNLIVDEETIVDHIL